MNTDPIADLLTRIRNAAQVSHPSVRVPASKAKERVLNVLLEEGYVHRFETLTNEAGRSEFKIFLKYEDSGKPVIRELKRLSRPGKRLYVGTEDVPRFKGGLGLVVVSTSHGMMSDREARKQGIGGELICSVF